MEHMKHESGSMVDLMKVMGPYMIGFNNVWGSDSETMIDYINRVAGSPGRNKFDAIAGHLKTVHVDEAGKQVGTVVVSIGEYNFTKGQAQDLVELIKVCRLSRVRPHLVFTGGVDDHERRELGELPSWAMQQKLVEAYRESCGHLMGYPSVDMRAIEEASLDSFSQNTGHQAWIVGGHVQAALCSGPVTVIASVGRSHVARYMATIMLPVANIPVFTYRLKNLTLVGFGDGDWSDETYGDVTHADAAFRLSVEAESDVQKKRYGQLTDRFFKEQNYWRERNYACGVLSAERMLDLFNFI